MTGSGRVLNTDQLCVQNTKWNWKQWAPCDVQQPKLEDDDDDDDDDDAEDEDAAAAVAGGGGGGGDWKCDDGELDGAGPSKSRRQTFDGPVLPLDADSTFALPGISITSRLYFTVSVPLYSVIVLLVNCAVIVWN